MIERITGECELCGSNNNPYDMYVDLQNHMWHVVCPKCFYKQYNGNDKLYYSKILNNVPDVLSYKRFKQHNKAMIVIADAFPYFKEGGKFFSEMEKDDAQSNAVKRFTESVKLKNKFTFVNVQFKSQEQINKGFGVVLVVGVRAYVRFNSYLEYMEHELYNAFRKSCPAIFNGM